MDQDSTQKTEQYLRTAVEHMPASLLMLDREGRIVLANREVERMFGYTRDELLQQPFENLVPGYDLEKQPGQPDTARELTGRRKDGAGIRIQLRLTPVPEEGSFVVSIADAPASKRAEQLFRAAIESAPSGIVIVDGSGAIALVNRETERLFDYAREELLGQSIEILVPERFRANHPRYRAEFSAHPSSRLMGGGRHLFGRRKDGTEIPVEIGLNPIQTDEGLYVLSVIADISERIKAEEALRKTAGELARSNADLEQFAYIASHDLQEPLRMVIGFLQLLQRKEGAKLDEKSNSYIDYAVSGAVRMSQLISDLLEYSRVQSKGKRVETVDLNQALDSAMANLQRSIQESAAAITRDTLPTVSGDPTQLTQLLQNLLGNAIKFSRKGVSPEISVHSRRNGQSWEIFVRDNGIGIDPEYADRIFMIFQRLHGPKDYPGTGIGLAICKKIVEQHGGRIWVESNPLAGSTFYFSLPG